MNPEQQDEDLDFARSTYLDLINKNNEALEQMMELAAALESPRMYEVLSASIKSTAEITDRLVELHKSNKQLSVKEESSKSLPNGGGGVTNNNLFIGSTEEFQRLLKDSNEDLVVNVEK